MFLFLHVALAYRVAGNTNIHVSVSRVVSEDCLSGTLSPTFPFGIQYIYSLRVSGGLRIKNLLIYDLTEQIR